MEPAKIGRLTVVVIVWATCSGRADGCHGHKFKVHLTFASPARGAPSEAAGAGAGPFVEIRNSNFQFPIANSLPSPFRSAAVELHSEADRELVKNELDDFGAQIGQFARGSLSNQGHRLLELHRSINHCNTLLMASKLLIFQLDLTSWAGPRRSDLCNRSCCSYSQQQQLTALLIH